MTHGFLDSHPDHTQAVALRLQRGTAPCSRHPFILGQAMLRRGVTMSSTAFSRLRFFAQTPLLSVPPSSFAFLPRQ